MELVAAGGPVPADAEQNLFPRTERIGKDNNADFDASRAV